MPASERTYKPNPLEDALGESLLKAGSDNDENRLETIFGLFKFFGFYKEKKARQ